MKKPLRVKLPDTFEEAVAKYWSIRSQWSDRSVGPIMTASQAIRTLGVMLDDYRLPKSFKCQVASFQQEIIRSGHKKTRPTKKSAPICSVLTIR